MGDVSLKEKVLPKFVEFWRAWDNHLVLVCKGGRNSAKSSHIALRTVFSMMENPQNALIVRRVGNTLEKSVFEQLLWAIDTLEVTHLWKVRRNPLSLVYKPTQCEMLFRGADEPEKIKGIKTRRYPITILWIEELAEFRNEESVIMVEESVLRAELPEGYKYTIVYSYNPPKQKQNWVNQKYNSTSIPHNNFIHHSTYLDNPYVSEDSRKKAEDMKGKDPQRYKCIYLGEATGEGIVPFSNLEFRPIGTEEFATFDNVKQGLDFGYSIDPVAFVQWHYSRTKNTIYAMREIVGIQIGNKELSKRMKAIEIPHTLIIADSAEPKSIDELKGLLHYVRGAKKPPGSIEHGEKWLGELDKIVIDHNRTPMIAKQFGNIDYATDRYGDLKNRLQDKANDTIDATRYALEIEMDNVPAIIF